MIPPRSPLLLSSLPHLDAADFCSDDRGDPSSQRWGRATPFTGVHFEPKARQGARYAVTLAVAVLSLLAFPASGAKPTPAAELKRLSLEEILQQEVTLVSRRPQRVSTAASSIQVISSDAIRRSGAQRLGEALRLAPNLQVAQIDSGRWAISARGFNSVLANKMLVMIDGRTVYSPLFAGVFWAAQEVPLEDVDRIEVVSGPGASQWGANAVNGVISVRSQSAWDTQGLLVTAGGGTGLRKHTSIRYGGAVGTNLHYRVYGRFAERDGNLSATGEELDNDWTRTQGGFRIDWEPADNNVVTLQSDVFENIVPTGNQDAISRGRNLLARWSRVFSPDSELEVQVYYDRLRLDVPASYGDTLDTYDLDVHHSFRLGDRHALMWGAGYRRHEDNFESRAVILLPERRTLEKVSAFLQDSVVLVPEVLNLTAGTRVEDSEYTGIEWQPSARLAWRPTARQSYWAAASRAVRTPSRLDRERYFPKASAGSPHFESETLNAWEIGGRFRLHNRISASLTAFYHDYGRIRSIELAGPGAPLPRELRNGQQGESYGAEFSTDLQLTSWWQLQAGLTELRVNIEPGIGSADTSHGALEAVDANRYASLRSAWDLPRGWELWAHLRHSAELTNRFSNVPAYTELDARLGWRPSARWEISVIGRNLLNERHAEYGDVSLKHEVERSVYALCEWSY